MISKDPEQEILTKDEVQICLACGKVENHIFTSHICMTKNTPSKKEIIKKVKIFMTRYDAKKIFEEL